MNEFIPVNRPVIGDREKRYLNEAIDTGWISCDGPFVKEFEGKFAESLGRKYAIAVSSGSAAIEVAISALGIGAGDEVLLPSLTIISCIAPIVRCGAKAILVDVDPLTWNMDCNQLEDKIGPRTKAIMVVHLYGLPVDMDQVLKLSRKYGLEIIEDTAEGLGAIYKGRKCGTFGDVSTFSFYPNKLITTGEGGMIVCDDMKIAEKCRSFRNLCFQEKRRFFHENLGWNFRMTNLQAGLGLAQLDRVEEFVEKKRWIGQRYNEKLNGLEGVQLPVDKTEYSENVYWIYGIVLKDEITRSRKQVVKRLTEEKVGTRPFFWPLHEQPVFRKSRQVHNDKLPVSEKLGRRGFYIPSGLGLEDEQIETVADRLIKVVRSL